MHEEGRRLEIGKDFLGAGQTGTHCKSYYVTCLLHMSGFSHVYVGEEEVMIPTFSKELYFKKKKK